MSKGNIACNVSAPCLNCQDRSVTCHSKCEKYKEFCKRNEEIRQKIAKSKAYYTYDPKKDRRGQI